MSSFPFSRIVIVNRGEPAMRLIRAVRELNEERGLALRTIALYTEPDQGSMFVREADEAFLLGPAKFYDPSDQRLKSTYLDYERLKDALKKTRAEAAWVGWGFVAEHAAFADLCRDMGVVFIGPPGEVMRALGDKISAKLLCEESGVPVAPWSGGAVEDLDAARRCAEKLGFPLMVKASAGGGGRGIRRVGSMAELSDVFSRARDEAAKAFGDGTVFLERAVAAARHVEVQVVADQHGAVWALGVRDCSVQRRNQKLIEEAPCPILPPQREAEIRAASVRLARKVGYVGVGTVEFLYAPEEQSFFFMEMNTRLQVEHPVTELTTGVDIVKLQLQVAAGERLVGEPPPTVGHAIEVRLNAEDPDRQFAPAPGRLTVFRLPAGPGLRVDAGLSQGDNIAPDFDSMIAKIIAFGRSREEALARLRRGLSESTVIIEGGTSNKSFLLTLLKHKDVVSGAVDIGWLDRLGEKKPDLPPFADVALVQAAIEAYDQDLAYERQAFLAAAARGRPGVREESGFSVELRLGGQAYTFQVYRQAPGLYHVRVEGVSLQIELQKIGRYEAWMTLDARRYRVISIPQGTEILVEVDGVSHRVQRDDGGVVRASAPAVVLSVNVQEGDEVGAGQVVAVLEAMKMELPVLSPSAGRVRQVLVGAGEQVPAGKPLLVLEPEQGAGAASEAPRVRFTTAAPPPEAAGPGALLKRCCHALDVMRRFLLGFDIDVKEMQAALGEFEIASKSVPPHEPEILLLEEQILAIFADVLAVHSRNYLSAEDHLSPAECFARFFRSLDSAGKGLPERFLERLERLLSHYGVSSLTRSPELEEALLWSRKAELRADLLAEPVVRVLERRIAEAERLILCVEPHFSGLLDRVIEVTYPGFLAVNDLARQVRFIYFDKPTLDRAQAKEYEALRADMQRLALDPRHPRRAEIIEHLAHSSQPIVGLLARFASQQGEAGMEGGGFGALPLEIFIRRFYRETRLGPIRLWSLPEGDFLRTEYELEGRRMPLFAMMAPYEGLSQGVGALARYLGDLPPGQEVRVDCYLLLGPSSPERARAVERFGQAMEEAGLSKRQGRVCCVLVNPSRARADYASFALDGGSARELPEYDGIHPMWAGRLDLWRLRNFHTERLSSPEDIYLYKARAKENPKDERLFAFVDVRDLTATYSEQEGPQLPHLERMFLDTMSCMRDYLYRLPPEKRLYWNRVLLYVWPELTVDLPDFTRVIERLARETQNLGIEKIVVRVRTGAFESSPELRAISYPELQAVSYPDLRALTVEDLRADPPEPLQSASFPERKPGDSLREYALHFSLGSGRVVRFRMSQPSAYPIRPLSAYARRVVQLRARGLVYPYEIIRLLTARSAEHAVLFPPGEFTEYDLDAGGSLIPVARPYGENTANLVVGVIRNFTPKHPEGMTRVILLGDPSREMGALAEPECRRIIAALDIAEKMRVPVDWFPLSSGAKIAMDSGTENLDWTALVLRRIVEFTQEGGEINVVVAGINVGAQSYWNAEATMLMHTRGALIMTPQAAMVLTGKKALEYSGSVAAVDHQGIGGVEAIMGPNGEAQYMAQDIGEALQILFRYYEHTYVAPGERFPRRARTADPRDRDITVFPYKGAKGEAFKTVGEIFSHETNPSRKKAFSIRPVMQAVIDQDLPPLERWAMMREAETGVVWDAHLGGIPVTLLGIESHPVPRGGGHIPGDGPEVFSGGTLFPLSSKKVARAINAASGNRPVVVLANLSGFDGSPESMRKLQLEYGAEIGRAVVNFKGPMVFCVISRYHGGAYVVFSRTLNKNLEVSALTGSYASVIGGAPAAAVVLTREVSRRVYSDPRVVELGEKIRGAEEAQKARLMARMVSLIKEVQGEKQSQMAEEFDQVHSIERAKEVGSIEYILEPARLRPYLIEALERGLARTRQ